jgi:cytochrome P450
MSAYCEPLSVLVLGRVLGIEQAGAATLRRWFAQLAAGGGNYEHDPGKAATGQAAAAEIDRALTRVLSRPAAHETLLEGMASARTLSQAEIRGNIKLMILGGMQEPAHTLGTTITALLSHPDQLERVRAAGSWREAIEEGIRWISPVGTATRTAAAQAEIAGIAVPAGTRLAAVLASANRDPSRWEHPERFDAHRQPLPHHAFGAGSHFCLGHALAREEITTGLRMLFEHAPGLELAAPVEHTGWEFRGPRRLLVRVPRA